MQPWPQEGEPAYKIRQAGWARLSASVSRCVGSEFSPRPLSPCWCSSADLCRGLSWPRAALQPGPSVLQSLSPNYYQSTRGRLQLVRLLSGARARLRARGHSSGCGGGSVVSCGVAQRVLWALVLRKLALWWKLPVREVRGRREIKPGRPARGKKEEKDRGRIWCQGQEILHKKNDFFFWTGTSRIQDVHTFLTK